MSKAILTNNDIAFMMEARTECRKLPGFTRRFWWAMELAFGKDKSCLKAAVIKAQRNGMYKRENA